MYSTNFNFLAWNDIIIDINTPWTKIFLFSTRHKISKDYPWKAVIVGLHLDVFPISVLNIPCFVYKLTTIEMIFFDKCPSTHSFQMRAQVFHSSTTKTLNIVMYSLDFCHTFFYSIIAMHIALFFCRSVVDWYVYLFHYFRENILYNNT